MTDHSNETDWFTRFSGGSKNHVILSGLGLLGLTVFAATQVGEPKVQSSTPSYSRPNIEEIRENIRVEHLVKRMLRDPDSAQFVHVGNGCGTVNSRNGFGGMSGAKRFITYDDVAAIEQDHNTREFQKFWTKLC